MQLRYDEDFLEGVVFGCSAGRRKGIPSLQVARFHREREKLYSVLDPEQRNTAFFKLHLDWFREWGLEKLLFDLIKEFPLLSQKLSLLVVRQTRGKTDEGAELYVNDTAQLNAVVALRPEWFVQDLAVKDFLRHEFMHLHDMLDPAFGYSPALQLPGLNPAQQRLARERYCLLWDITIDGRLAASGHSPVQPREKHAAAFARGYSFWPADKQAALFDLLWNCRDPRHDHFLEMIADPRGLRDAQRPSPGASCPLCEFPTFAWAPDERLRPDILRRICAEFPAWQPQQGLCNRCLETYEAVASLVVCAETSPCAAASVLDPGQGVEA